MAEAMKARFHIFHLLRRDVKSEQETVSYLYKVSFSELPL